jgi:hypothetical protein
MTVVGLFQFAMAVTLEIHGYSLSGQDVSLKAYFLKPELTFGELDIQLMGSQLLQDYPQVLTMLFRASRIDKYIIDEDNDELVQFFH